MIAQLFISSSVAVYQKINYLSKILFSETLLLGDFLYIHDSLN